MKRLILSICLVIAATSTAQQHFAGISTSSRTSLINGSMNPAELTNITTTYEINVLSPSVNASSNKVGFSDLVSGNELEEKIFEGSDAANLSIDAEILGPGVAYKWESWTFALSTKANAKLYLVDIDVNIGDAIANAGINSIAGSTTISNNFNQRVNGTTWGEVGLSAARDIFDNEQHKISGGVSFKLLFPGSYANFGADRFTGTVNNVLGNGTLTDTQANLNIAYSGNLGNDFTDFNDYAKSLYGKLNGLAVDLGVNYRLKDMSGTGYRVNAGLSVRNIGGMTFRSSNNSSTNYVLSIQGTEALDLNQFENVESLEEVEDILLASGYLNRTNNRASDFKVKLPTIFTGYADVRIIPDLFATIYTQQRLSKNDDNNQIATENVTSLTPRYLLSNVEFMLPLSINEISGFAAGVGFRAYGFFLGSSSILSALISDSKQADIFLGYSFGI
ncbi:MAG TPA: hypothetical protein VGB50_00760 [Flavobacterium sp.]|jgi:hypothetical protein